MYIVFGIWSKISMYSISSQILKLFEENPVTGVEVIQRSHSPSHVISHRMGKTRNLFKKIGENKGTFHARMGKIKDRNSKDITEVEEIKKQS